MNATDETPVDLAAVQADDALLDMLGAGQPGDEVDRELARVLVVWRRDVDAEPVGEMVDTGTALAVISSGRSFLARVRAAVRGFLRSLGGER